MCPHPDHFQRNSDGGFFDARSLSGSTVRAGGSYRLVQDSTALVLVKDASSVILVEPLKRRPASSRQAAATAEQRE